MIAGLLVLWGHGSSFTGRGDPTRAVRSGRPHAVRRGGSAAAGAGAARGAGPPHLAAAADTSMRSSSTDPIARSLRVDRRLQGHARQHAGVEEDRIVRLETLAARGRSTSGAPVQRSSALLEQFTAVLRAWRASPAHAAPAWTTSSGSTQLGRAPLPPGTGPRRRSRADRRRFRSEDVATTTMRIPHPLAATVSELVSARRAGLVDLTGATDAAFVDAVLDSEPNALSADFRARLAARTGGHALFTIELLRGMQLRGDLLRMTGRADGSKVRRYAGTISRLGSRPPSGPASVISPLPVAALSRSPASRARCSRARSWLRSAGAP
jgi:hypothetical protein